MVLNIPKYPVPLFRLFWKMGGWMVLITGALLVLFTLISQSNLKTARRFEAEGRSTVALITDKEKTVRRDSDGNDKVSYWLTFEFVTGLGQAITVRQSVGRGQYNSLKQGDELPLFYLASEPGKVELTQGSHREGARVTQWIALIAGLVWLAALWIIGGWAVSAVRARRFGPRKEAMVQEIKRTNLKINNQPRYRLVWRDKEGREGQSLLHRHSVLDSLRPNDIIHIYQGPKQSWWVGDVGERPEFTS